MFFTRHPFGGLFLLTKRKNANGVPQDTGIALHTARDGLNVPRSPIFLCQFDRCLEASSRRQMRSKIVSTRRFLGMAQPAKPLIVLHAGTNDPMPKRQILRSCGRMWKRRRRIAFETCHITLSPNTVPFRFRKLVCFTSVKPCHKPSQTPLYFHESIFPRLFYIDSKSGFKA